MTAAQEKLLRKVAKRLTERAEELWMGGAYDRR